MVGASPEPGHVIRVDARVCWVRAGDALLKCTIRGRLFREATALKHPVAVGDRVAIVRDGPDSGVVERVEPRRNKLSRPAVEAIDRKEQVIVANIDLLGIVVAAAKPPLRTGLIDRYLMVAARESLEPIVIVNKIDLADMDAVGDAMAVYERLGIEVHYTAALRGDGIERLRARIDGVVTVFSGHSGVGKSTLLNAIVPDLALRTGHVSSKTGKGRHTTTQVVLHELDRGCLIDTPGIRAMGLWQIGPADVDRFFTEIAALEGQCRFLDCAHGAEPDCAVKGAVEDGSIDRRRYDSYRRIVESLESGETPGRSG